MSRERIKSFFDGKRVLYLSHKDPKYIRCSQEIALLNDTKSYEIVTADAKLKLWKYFHAMIKIFIGGLVKAPHAEVIFIGYLPQLILPVLYPFIRRKTIIIDFFISLYDTIVFDKKIVSPSHPLGKLAYWLDKKTLSLADHALADTKTHAAYFAETFGAAPEKISVLYLEADRSIYYPKSAVKTGPFENKFMVLYFGTVLPLQGVEVILAAAEMLDDNEQIQFCFIGPLKERVREKFGSLGNVTFMPWVTQDQLADYIAMSDLCLAGHFHGTIEKARRVIAGKTYIYDAMEKVMVLGECGSNRELYDESNPHVRFVEMGSPQALVEVIVKEYTLLPVNGRPC